MFLCRYWGSSIIVTRGKANHGESLPGFLAVADGANIGLILYRMAEEECEVVSLNSEMEGMGVGTALLEAVHAVAVEEKCRRLWLITTNDNLAAVRFYQKRGFVLRAVHPNAMEKSRRIKPEIPLFGLDWIPIRDEIELDTIL